LLPNQEALLRYRIDLEFNLNHENEKNQVLATISS